MMKPGDKIILPIIWRIGQRYEVVTATIRTVGCLKAVTDNELLFMEHKKELIITRRLILFAREW